MPHIRDRGFTLIELMVVVIIIGILSVSVAFSVSQDSHRTALREAHRLATLLEIAMAETQSGKRRLAWSAHPEGYEFLVADATGHAGDIGTLRWAPLIDDATLHPRKLADDIRITRVDVDRQPLPAGSLLILRRGDPPLFHIVLDTGGQTSSRMIELRSLPTGRVEVIRDGASATSKP